MKVEQTNVKEWTDTQYNSGGDIDNRGLLETKFLTTENKLTGAKHAHTLENTNYQFERVFPSHTDLEELPSFKQELEEEYNNSLRMKNLHINNFMMGNLEIVDKGAANSRNKGQFSGLTKTTGQSLAPRNSYQILNLDNFLAQGGKKPSSLISGGAD